MEISKNKVIIRGVCGGNRVDSDNTPSTYRIWRDFFPDTLHWDITCAGRDLCAHSINKRSRVSIPGLAEITWPPLPSSFSPLFMFN